MKKEDTPMRIARRNYEERNKELRKKTNPIKTKNVSQKTAYVFLCSDGL